jgi:hypothetical protein
MVWAGPDATSASNPEGKQEVISALVTLQRNIEQQQGAQSALIANLSAQWEQRFMALEQGVNSGLKICTTTAASMNERSGKFLRLGEVLEGALDRIVDDGKDMATLSQNVSKTQRDVERLVQELADEKGERRQAITDLARQVDGQVAGLRGQSVGVGSALSHNPKAAAELDSLRGEVGRLQRELAEEVTERRQLSRELQLSTSDTAQLKEKLDALQDQSLRISRDVNSTRDEVRQVARDCAQVWGGELSTGPVSQDFRNDLAHRIDSVGRELRGDLDNGSGSPDNRGLQRGAVANAAAAAQQRRSSGGSAVNKSIVGNVSIRRPATIPEEGSNDNGGTSGNLQDSRQRKQGFSILSRLGMGEG